MSDLRSRVAYLHGLAEGLDIDAASTEGRMLAAMIDVLDDLAGALDDVYEAQGELAEYVEEMDHDLSSVQEIIFEAEGADDDGEPPLVFVPDRTVDVAGGAADDLDLVCCAACGEPIGAGAGEMPAAAEFDVNCPVCGCSMVVEEPGR